MHLILILYSEFIFVTAEQNNKIVSAKIFDFKA